MKRALVVVLMFAAANVYSANLVNKDSKRYDISIQTVGTTHTFISGSTTMSSGAPDGATIKVKDTGSTIKVSGSSDVIIKDGKLSQ